MRSFCCAHIWNRIHFRPRWDTLEIYLNRSQTDGLTPIQLQTDAIQKKLDFEQKKMDVIREKSREQYRRHDETQLFYDEQCAPQLTEIFGTILSDEQRTNALLNEGKSINTAESGERIQAIRDHLKSGNFDQVAEYIIQLDGKVGHELEWKSMNINEQTLYFVTLLKTYLFDDFVSDWTTVAVVQK